MRRRSAVTAAAALCLLAATASVPLDWHLPARIVRASYEIERLGFVYSWGGGHAADPGPSLGTCVGYRGKIRPCPAADTLGLDCSGFSRWVYALAYGEDVLGPGNTDEQVRRLRRVDVGRPGDLVFYGQVTEKSINTHHVGVYLGGGKMMDSPYTGMVVRIDPVGGRKDFAGFYRY
ncbi:NlpC/P60 family protein [Nonomuraea sp. B12E4]|uniref:C40 family peptidase n=1 Tax=Nonomuraea sp. B12E4 TaxID=3153564 RepID=UPI00325F1E83